MKRVFLLCILALLFSLQLSGLEISEGRIKLIIHENTGRFSIYYLENVSRNQYTPLLLTQDPRTTVLSVLIENRVYRMGESGSFRQSVEETVNGAQISWQSTEATVTQSFQLIRSANSSLANGVLITITIENVSEQPLSIGARYLFDTYLGEDENNHFFVGSEMQTINREYSINANSSTGLWVSKEENSDIGFMQSLSGEGITRPDRVVFANWKRLDDTPWSYDVNTTRNFSRLPYSINDSAAAVYFNPTTVASGSSREITLAIGNFNTSGFSASTAETSNEELHALHERSNESSAEDATPENTIRTDLIRVRDIINQIDRLLSLDREITESEIEVLENLIEELENKVENGNN
ncbi:MAG: hypothetical protein ACLFR1_00985 [Spirochaetia bacterium]